jgi:hypothetical protein
MAEVTHFHDERTTVETHTGDTNWVNYGTETDLARVLGSSLSATTNYLIYCKALFGGNQTNGTFGIRIATADDSSIASKSESVIEPGYNGAERMSPFIFAHSFQTDASPADVMVEIKTFASGNTARVDQVSLFVIDLDDLGSSNYFETVHADPGATITELGIGEASASDMGTISASNLGTTEEWLVIGYGRVEVGSTTRSYGMRGRGADDAASVSTLNYHFEEGEDTSELRVLGVACRHKAVTSNVAASVEGWEEHDAAEMYDRGGYIIALKGSAFADFQHDYTAGSVLVTGSETTIASIANYTPSTATNHLIIGRANCADTGANSRTVCYVENGAGTNLMTGDELIQQTFNRDPTDQEMIASSMRESLPASQDTFDLQAIRNTTAPDADRNFEHRWLLMLNLEKATADKSGHIYWTELELPDAPRVGRIHWTELEIPNAPRVGNIYWTELEIPTAPRVGNIYWAELEIPTAPRLGNIYWTELELPDAPRSGRIHWTELEIPPPDRIGQIYWTELEVPNAPRVGRIHWTELEVPDATNREGNIYWAELEIPPAARTGNIYWTELEMPNAGRVGHIYWAELEVPEGPRVGNLYWTELEIPDAARVGNIYWTELEIPNAPRVGNIYWTELELPNAPNHGRLYWAELELPNAPRVGHIYWTELRLPGAPGSAPGEGTYAGMSARTAMRARVVFDGGTDVGQELVEAVAQVTGFENVGEVLGNLRLAGATSKELPGALQDLSEPAVTEDLELEAAYVLFAETYP